MNKKIQNFLIAIIIGLIFVALFQIVYVQPAVNDIFDGTSNLFPSLAIHQILALFDIFSIIIFVVSTVIFYFLIGRYRKNSKKK